MFLSHIGVDEERQHHGLPPRPSKSRSPSIGVLYFLYSAVVLTHLQIVDIAEGIRYLHDLDPQIVHADIRGVCTPLLEVTRELNASRPMFWYPMTFTVSWRISV